MGSTGWTFERSSEYGVGYDFVACGARKVRRRRSGGVLVFVDESVASAGSKHRDGRRRLWGSETPSPPRCVVRGRGGVRPSGSSVPRRWCGGEDRGRGCLESFGTRRPPGEAAWHRCVGRSTGAACRLAGRGPVRSHRRAHRKLRRDVDAHGQLRPRARSARVEGFGRRRDHGSRPTQSDLFADRASVSALP